MGRKAFGQRNFMEAVLELAAGDEVYDPLHRLAAQTKQSPPTVTKYVEALERQGFIEVVVGERRSIIRLKILKRDVSGLENFAPMHDASKPPGKFIPLLPPEAPKPVTPNEPIPKFVAGPVNGLPKVVVLMDYNNIQIEAHQKGIQLSWSRVLDYVRGLGCLISAEVYVSWKASHYTEDTVRILDDAGFKIILCPKRYKDKDGVDSKMIESGKNFIRNGEADIIVIGSLDGDFGPIEKEAVNFHKKPVRLDINKARCQIEGPEFVQPLADDREAHIFGFALQAIIDGRATAVNAGPRYIGFLKEIIMAADRAAVLEISNFHEFRDKVWCGVSDSWKVMFTPNQAKSALQTCLRCRLVVSGRNGVLRVDPNHPAARMLLNPTS